MSDIQRAQETIRNEKAALEVAASLERLRNNKDFQAVILQGYLKDHMHSKLQSSISGHFNKEEKEDMVAAAQATAYLIEFFQEIERRARTANSTIRDNEKFILELQQEGGE